MNIGIISNLYPPIARGGAEHVARRVAHELHIRGHGVFVFSTQPFKGIKSCFGRITERSVEAVYRMYPPNLYHLLNDYNYIFPLRAAWHLIDMYSPFPAYELGRVLDVEKPDILLTHNLKGLGLKVVREIRKRQIPQIHTLHDVQLSVPSGMLMYGHEDAGLNGTFLRTWYERRIQNLMGSPEIVISPSRYLAKFYRHRDFFPNSRWELMPNPVPHTPNVSRAQGAIGPLCLLYVGQLEPQKGVKFLLETLNDSGLDFKLHIAGEGSLAGYIAGWAERDSRVVYHGFVPFRQLNELLSITDAVVVPSLCYENSPTIIYESFGSGVPVIASHIGGVGELVKDGDNGFLFSPGDKQGLLEALVKYSQNRAQFWIRASEIRKYIMPYSIVNYVDRLEELMEEVKH